MKKIILLVLSTAFVCIFSLSFTIEAEANLIGDGYIGADDHGYGDVIGDKDIFEIFGADVYRSGTDLHVEINTNFAGKAGVFGSLTPDNEGIGYGDLFLSTSWNPDGTSPYDDDDHSNGTLWTYGFSLDDRWDNNGGSGQLYSLGGASNNANAKLSQDFLTGGIYRDGQEAAVDTVSGNVVAIDDLTGSWAVNNPDNLISFVIDIGGTELATSDLIAFHWGMTCMNDTIEGIAPVPEPATMLLTGFGLLGMGAYFRARLRKKSKSC